MSKILVIDDEESIRSLLDTLLSRKGHEVVLAENLKMPEMDGLTVLKALRRRDSQRPVIVLTGAGTPEMEQQVPTLGVTEFVEKEFSLHQLGAALMRLLKSPHPVA
jgi:DNA-binding NtrC family response regulator